MIKIGKYALTESFDLSRRFLEYKMAKEIKPAFVKWALTSCYSSIKIIPGIYSSVLYPRLMSCGLYVDAIDILPKIGFHELIDESDAPNSTIKNEAIEKYGNEHKYELLEWQEQVSSNHIIWNEKYPLINASTAHRGKGAA